MLKDNTCRRYELCDGNIIGEFHLLLERKNADIVQYRNRFLIKFATAV